MPTPRQVRFHYGKIMRLHHRLANALTEAHSAGVIKYDDDLPNSYTELAPCWAHWECHKRIISTTEKALAQAMRQEIEK